MSVEEKLTKWITSSYPFKRSLPQAPNGLAHVRSLLYELIFAKQSWWHFSCKRGKHICYVNMCSTALESVVYTQTGHPLQTADIVSYKWILAVNLQTCSTSNMTCRIKLPLIRFDSFQISHTSMKSRSHFILLTRPQLLSFSSNLSYASQGDWMGLYGHGMYSSGTGE